MATAYPMTTRASGHSVLIIEKPAAGPVGPAVARVKVHCKLQTVTSCALTTASTAVMEVMN